MPIPPKLKIEPNIVKCPECEHEALWPDEFEALGAEDWCVFCAYCDAEIPVWKLLKQCHDNRVQRTALLKE